MAERLKPEFSVLEDFEALSHEAARCLVVAAREAVICTGRCTVVLAGGTTPRRLYQLLASDEYLGAFPWEAAEWFWGDERCVPPDDPRSNYRLAFDALLGPAGVAPERIHRIAGEARPPEREAQTVEAVIRDLVPDGEFDVVLLGAGTDGHTASLFPGSSALDERERWMLAVEADRSHPVRQRITMTLPLLDRARNVFVLAAGEAKAEVVGAVADDPDAAARRYPVARLRPAGHLAWLVDRAAMSGRSPAAAP